MPTSDNVQPSDDHSSRKNDRFLSSSEMVSSGIYRCLQTIFDTTDTIYVLMDHDFRIISFNPRAVAFAQNELGHKIQISEYLLDYFPVERQSMLLSYMLSVQRGHPINYEVNYPQAAGSFHWYYVRWFPISNDNEKACGLMMAVSDITEKKQLEQRLEEERARKQREITEAVITAEEKERHEIGLELHDNVNQVLTAAQLYLGMVKETGENKDTSLLDQVDKLIGDAINEIRNLSHAMIPPLVDESGLKESIHYLVKIISKATPFRFFTEIDIDESSLDTKRKLTIYRIIQEQFSNIIKHANAKTITLRLLQEKESLVLHIIDDGSGFNMTCKGKGVGLVNIKTRASLINGKAEILSAPGKGCELTVTIALTL